LTGFKNIASIILETGRKKKFIAGGEESYGYLIGDFVRDKDGVSACAMVAEVIAYYKTPRKNLYFDCASQRFYAQSLVLIKNH